LVGVILAIVFAVVLFNNGKNIKTYNVSFDTNGGNAVSSQTVEENNKVVKPTDPTKEGYIFVEWILNSATYDFNSVVTKDLVLTAKWEKVNEDTEKYTIKFNTDGGTTIPNQVIEKGNKVERPSNLTKTGYIFKGWTLNGSVYNFSTKVTKNITLEASWKKIETNNQEETQPKKTYTITFSASKITLRKANKNAFF